MAVKHWPESWRGVCRGRSDPRERLSSSKLDRRIGVTQGRGQYVNSFRIGRIDISQCLRTGRSHSRLSVVSHTLFKQRRG